MAVKWLVGAPKIGKYMGWSALKTLRMARKYGFPLMRLPAQNRLGWAYHTTPELIMAWYASQIDTARDHLLHQKAAKPTPLREKYKGQHPPFWRKPAATPSDQTPQTPDIAQDSDRV